MEMVASYDTDADLEREKQRLMYETPDVSDLAFHKYLSCEECELLESKTIIRTMPVSTHRQQ